METNEQAKAIGTFLIACTALGTYGRGGKQKLQKVVGNGIVYQGENGKELFFNTEAIKELPIHVLAELTEKIKIA